jgi:hypothetical protein
MFVKPTPVTPDFASSDSAFTLIPEINSAKPLTGYYRKAGAATGEYHEITISHVVSNENKSIPSYRHLVRLDHVLPDSDGVPVKASAYLVIVEPQGTITPTNVDDLVLRLLHLLLTYGGETPFWSDTTVDMTQVKTDVLLNLSSLRDLQS